MIEVPLQGELDAYLGYAKYDYENKKTEDSRMRLSATLQTG